MQLKGLVRIIAVLFLGICLYYLSFTLWARNHESDMEAKAKNWVSRSFAKPSEKYPNAADANLKIAYEDSLKIVLENKIAKLLDSTKATKVGPFGFTTYRAAKDQELALGLDLQGGMSVTE